MKILPLLILITLSGCAEKKEISLIDSAKCLGSAIADKDCEPEKVDITRIEIILTTD